MWCAFTQHLTEKEILTMVKKLHIMNTWEAFRLFLCDEEWNEATKNIDWLSDELVQEFLDEKAIDIRRLNDTECELLKLDYEKGFYISTWNDEYLSTEY
jgi:hypothetical protein